MTIAARAVAADRGAMTSLLARFGDGDRLASPGQEGGDHRPRPTTAPGGRRTAQRLPAGAGHPRARGLHHLAAHGQSGRIMPFWEGASPASVSPLPPESLFDLFNTENRKHVLKTPNTRGLFGRARNAIKALQMLE